MPEVAGSWPEEGAQYVPGAPMEPVQQGFPPQQQYAQQQYQQQQQYPQQGYQEQQYAQQQYQQQQQQYQQQAYQDQTVPQQAVAVEEEQSSVPSEFDHLFRDSSPENRKSISGRQPVVSGPGAAAPGGFPQQQPAQQQAPQATAVYAPPQQQAYEDRVPDYQPQQQPFGGGYGEPGGPGSGGGAGGRRTPLIIGGAVAAIAAIGLYLGLSGGGSAKSPTAGPTASTSTHVSTETAQQQAAAVYQLVQQSKQLRSDINAEVGSLESCSNVSSLQAELTNTAQARQSQATQVAKLDVSKISGGAALASALNAAWSDSAASDADYAKAAGDFTSGGCSKGAVKNDPNFQAASQGSSHVTNEKADAVTKWNNTMTNYGQPQITLSDL